MDSVEMVTRPVPTLNPDTMMFDSRFWPPEIVEGVAAKDAAVASATSASGSESRAAQHEVGALAAKQDAEGAATSAATAAGEASSAASSAESSRDLAALSADSVASPVDSVTWSGPVTMPATTGFLHVTLTGNAVLALPPGPDAATTVNLLVKQDSAGGRKLTLANAATSFGVPITLTTSPNALDLVSLVWTGSAWLAVVGALSLMIPTDWIV